MFHNIVFMAVAEQCFGSIANKYNIQELSLSDFIYWYINVQTMEKYELPFPLTSPRFPSQYRHSLPQ